MFAEVCKRCEGRGYIRAGVRCPACKAGVVELSMLELALRPSAKNKKEVANGGKM